MSHGTVWVGIVLVMPLAITSGMALCPDLSIWTLWSSQCDTASTSRRAACSGFCPRRILLCDLHLCPGQCLPRKLAAMPKQELLGGVPIVGAWPALLALTGQLASVPLVQSSPHPMVLPSPIHLCTHYSRECIPVQLLRALSTVCFSPHPFGGHTCAYMRVGTHVMFAHTW